MALTMCISLSVFAASTSFSAKLPANQGDTEVSTVRKESSTTDYFTITVNSIGTGTDKVCAWTEGDSTGFNYSSPYNQVGKETKNIKYSHIPDKGENVVLNLDNLVSLSYTVSVSGSWDPH